VHNDCSVILATDAYDVLINVVVMRARILIVVNLMLSGRNLMDRVNIERWFRVQVCLHVLDYDYGCV